MTILLDNITATIVAMSVLVTVLVMQHRAQDAGVQRSVTYQAKKQTLELGSWLQDDLANVGAGVSFGAISVVDRNENADGLTTSFEFRRKLEEDDASAVNIRYALVETEAISVGGEEVQLYQLERRVDGTVVGKSPDTITDFSIEMLDAGGQYTDAPSDARQLRVQLSSALPFSDQKLTYLRETHWGTTLPVRGK
jgi:hypothetical protein